jgi:type VI secretion system secreted protein Hcp
MPANIALKFDDASLNGSSKLKKSKDAIEVYSFRHRISIPLSSSQASNMSRTQGRTHHEDLTIGKLVDKASPNLNLYCSQGKIVGNATLTIYEPNADAPQPVCSFKLENVIISSVVVGGGADDLPSETVTLNYSAITWTQGTSNSTNWDLTTNAKK